MALGSNIEYRASALFQATLDEKTAKQLEGRFTELSKKAAEMSREEFQKAFQSLGAEINKSLAKLKISPINMEDIIKLPQAEVFSQFGAELGKRLEDGIHGAISGGSALDGVRKEFDRLIQDRDRLLAEQRIAEAEYKTRASSADKINFNPYSKSLGKFEIDNNISKKASDLLDNFYEIDDKLQEADSRAKGYVTTLTQWIESASNLYKMRNTLSAFEEGGGKASSLIGSTGAQFFLGDDIDDATMFGADAVADFSDEGFAIEYQERIESINKQLAETNSQIDLLTQKHPELINKSEVDVTLNRLQQIEDAYKRIQNKDGSIHKNAIGKIQESLDYAPGDKSRLKTLGNNYNKSVTAGENWEDQYGWLVKFIREYEALQSKLNSDSISSKKKVDIRASLKEHTALYEQLKPMAAEAENMLQNVINMANNVPLIGMGGDDTENAKMVADEAERKAAADREAAEAKAKAAAEAQNEAVADATAKTDADAKALADKEAAEAARLAAEAAKKERIETEAAAKAAREKADARRSDLLNMVSTSGMSKEKFAYMNTGVGEISSYIEGQYQGVGKTLRQDLLNTVGGSWDSTVHTHPELVAAPSEDDIQSFVNHYEEFRKNFILAGKQLAEIDFTSMTQQQAQQLADVYKKNVLSAEDESFDRLYNTPLKDLGIKSLDIDKVLKNVSQQLMTQFPKLTTEINAYIENLRLMFKQNPITTLSHDQIEENISNSVGLSFKGSNKHLQADIHQTTQDVVDNITGIPSLYQKELQGIFTQTIGDLGLDPSKIFKLHNVEDFQAQLDLVRQESMAHKENTKAIHEETNAQEKLNNAESKNPNTEQNIKKEAMSYDELRQKVVDYLKVRDQMFAAMAEGRSWTDLVPGVDAAKDAVTSLFPKTGDQSVTTSDMVGNMLKNSTIDEDYVKQLAVALGIEIPEAAQKASGAIKIVADAQEKLNAAENQNPPAQDDSGVHKSNKDAIDAEIQAIEKRGALLSQAYNLYYAAKYPETHPGELEGALQNNPNLISDLTLQRDSLQGKLQPVQEMANKISQMSSIKDIPLDQLRQEAINVGQQLSTMYDQGIRDTEEYIALQYKLIKIIDKIGASYGGAKGAGAKDISELRRWVRNSIESEFGTDPMDTNVVDALWGQGKFSIMKTNSQTFNMRDVAAKLLNYDGLGGISLNSDSDDLSKINFVIEELSKIPQVANTAKTSVDGLNDSLQKKDQIEKSDNDGAEVADENAKTEAIKHQNETLKENINLKNQANGQGVVTGATTGTGTGTGTGITTGNVVPTQTIPDGAISAEATQLESIRAKLVEVTAAVNTKTQAFINEEAEVKRVVTSEIASLDLLEQKVTTIKSTLEGLLGNLKTGSGDVGAGLSNINVTVNKNDAVDTEQKGAWALDTTAQSIKGTLDGIRSDIGNVVNAISTADTKALSTVVSDAPATENTLVAIKGVLDSINGKVQTGVGSKSTSGTTGGADDKAMVRYEQGADSQDSGVGGGQKPTEQIKTALTSLLKYKTTLQEAGQLSGDLESGINNLSAELSQVSDKAGLSKWNEHFKQFKNASAIIQTLVKDYQALGQAQARAAMESDAVKQMQYLDNAQIIKDRIATKSVDVNVGDNRFEEARQIAYNTTQHTLQQKQAVADAEKISSKRVKVEKAALQEQEKLVNQWTKLITKISVLEKQIKSGAFDDQTKVKKMKEYDDLRAQVDQIRPKIKTTDDVWNRVGEAYVAGSETATSTMSSSALPGLAKLYQQLGTAQADFESKQTSASKTAVDQIREKISGQQMSLQLSQQELAVLQQIASVAYRNQTDMLQSTEKDNRIKEWSSLIARMESLNTQINSGEFNEAQVRAMEDQIGLINRRIDELRPLIDMDDYNYNQPWNAQHQGREKGEEAILKQRAKNFKQQIKESQDGAKLRKASSAYNKGTEILGNAMNIDGTSPDRVAALERYNAELQKLKTLHDQAKKSGDLVKPEEQQAVIAQTQHVNTLTAEIQELISNYERLSGENSAPLREGTFVDANASSDVLKKQLTDAVMLETKGNASIKSFDHTTKELTYTLKTGANEFTTYTAAVRQTDGAMRTVRGTTTKTMGVFESIGKKIKEYSYYFTGSMMIYRVIAWVREGITAVKDIDSAMTELKKVTDETEESYDRFLDTAEKTASKVGSTVKDIVSSTADWARLGYSMKEAAQMAESTQILMNVSEFDDVSKATDTLISAVQAFKYSAEESMDVVDIMNTIGNNYAISTADLATSLTKSSGSLVAANGTLEEAVALTATANTIIQDADVVGTALKTVAMRLRGTSTEEMAEEGLDTDGAVTSKSKLQSKVQALSGVNILTDAGAYKSTYQILSEIADVWESINDMDQAALLELLAGKRAGSVMSAILQNPETLKDAFESASDASGSALIENEKYLDSIQGRIDLFNNSLQTMWNNELNSDVIKWFVGLGKVLIEVIDSLGLLPSAFIIVSLAIMKMNKMNLVEYFGSISKSIVNTATKFVNFGKSMIVGAKSMVAANTAVAQSTELTTVGSLRNAMAVAKVDDANKSAILSQLGLAGANKTQSISRDSLTASTLGAMVAEGKLTQAQANTIMSLLGIQAASNEVNAARMNEILVAAGLEKTQRAQIITQLGLSGSTKNLTKDAVLQAMANAGLDKTQQAAILSALGLTGANKGLAASFGALWTAMWPILALMAGIAIIYGVVKLFDKIITTTDELKEELDDLNSEISEMKSDLDSLNSELETTQDRMEELLSMDSLSFTEQEELENLRLQNAELERQIKLQEILIKSKEEDAKNKAKEVIKRQWDSSEADKSYIIDSLGEIRNDIWYASGVNTKDALDTAMSYYNDSKTDYVKYQEILEAWKDGDDKANKDLLTKYGYENLNARTGKSVIENSLEETKKKMDKQADGIDLVLGDMSKIIEENNLSYSMGDKEVDRFLDEYYAYSIKWANTQGAASKSSVISAIWDDTNNEAMASLKENLDEIAKSDASDKQIKAQKLIQDALDDTTGKYDRLNTFMNTVGVTAEEMAEFFVATGNAPNIGTFGGVLQVFADGEEILKKSSEYRNQISAEMADLQKNGSVDLFNRKQIKTSDMMRSFYSKDEYAETLAKELEGVTDQDLSTVWTQTFSNKDFGLGGPEIAMNFTPILPDGTVMEKDEFEGYVAGVLGGAEDTLQLKIGSTFDGENAIEEAAKTAERIHVLQEDYFTDVQLGVDEAGEAITWNDLFKTEDGEKVVDNLKVAAILEGADENIRGQFIKIIEEVENGTMSVNEAFAKWEMTGIDRAVEVLNTEFESLNNEMFPDAADEISGLIDTVNELKSAFESVVDSIDLLHEAQTQFNNSGRVSVKTALEIMSTTDEWDKVLNITEDSITLVDGAEQALIQTKLDSIATQTSRAAAFAKEKYEAALAAQTARELSDAERGVAETQNSANAVTNQRTNQMGGLATQTYNTAISELDYAGNDDVVQTAESVKSKAIGLVSASIVGLDAAIQALVNGEGLKGAFDAWSTTYGEARGAVIADANSYTTTVGALRKDYENKRDIANVAANADKYEEFRDNYDFEKTPGDKYDDDGDEDDAFQRAMDYWENRIGANQARYEQLQSEIDLLESKGQKADASYYEEQIKLENERLSLLQQQKAEAQSFLGTFAEGSDEWWEVANTLNEIEGELDSVAQSIVNLQDAIGEIDTYKFEEFNTRLDNLVSKLETIRDLIAPDGEEDWFDDEGNWTEAGVAVLGSQVQQLEMYKQGLEETRTELDKYNKAYSDNTKAYYEGLGIHSEQEYYEKTQELTEQQYDFANSISDTEQSIVDMYESNIDAVEEYIQTLIDGYNDYIDSVKEALDAERD